MADSFKPDKVDSFKPDSFAPDRASVPGMELLGGTPPPAPKPPNALRPSVKMTNRDGQITDAGANVPMGTAATIATAPLEASKRLLEASGRSVTTGAKRINNSINTRKHSDTGPGLSWNPLKSGDPLGNYDLTPTSEELGGTSDALRGVGEAALPIAAATNPTGVAVGTAAGVPVGAAVESGAKALGVPEGTSEFLGTAAGAGAGTAAEMARPNVVSGVKAKLNAIDPVEGIVKGLKPQANRTGFGSSLQRSLPELKATEGELPGKKISGINDLLDAIEIAKQRVWNQYKAITGPQAKSYTSGSPIADAMDASIPDQLRFENPAKAKALQQDANVYRQPLTVEQLESFLKTTNAELDSYYAKNPLARRIAAGKNPDTAALEAKGSAIRDALYNATDSEGEGAAPRELKQRYGALLEMERAAWPRRNVAARQQPNSLAEQVGKIAGYGQMAKGGIKLLTGNLSGAADIGMGLSEKELGTWMKEQQTTDALIRRSFENYKGSPAPVQAPPPFQPKGLLTKGDIVTPPPVDGSYVRSAAPAPHQQVNRMRPALPPGNAPFTQGTSVPDVLGRPGQGTPYNAGLIEQGGSGGGNFTRPNIITPPPADTSFVRGAQGMNAPPFQRKALPPPSTTEVPISPFARPTGETTPPQTGAPNADPSFVRSVPASINPATGKPWTPEELAQYPIPKYARGGVIKHPTLLSDLATGAPTGIMAEAGPEAITPLARPPRAAVTPPSVRLHPHVARSAKQRGAIFEAMRHKGTPPPVRFR